MPYDNSEVIRSKFRPQNKQVELEIRLNTSNSNYDRSKGEQIALNADGCQPAANDRSFSSSVMDKQTLRGAAPINDPGRYAIGILDNNELHLTEVKGMLHLRPSLGYLDKSDRVAKAEGRVAADPDDPPEPEVKPEAVTVKFARGDPERNRKYKEKSYDYQMKRVEEEPWVETRFHQLKTGAWEEVSQRMFCGAMEHDVKSLDETPERYLYSLKDNDG